MIRPFTLEDLNETLTLWEAASAVAHPFFSDAFANHAKELMTTVYMPNATGHTWVWCDEDHVLKGFISMIDNEIGGLFVDPRAQRMGIGKALVDHVRSMHKTLEVEVFKNNVIGSAFYHRYGFTLMHEQFHEESGQLLLRLNCCG